MALHVNAIVATEEPHAHFSTYRLLIANFTAVSCREGIGWNLLFNVVIEVDLFSAKFGVLTNDVSMDFLVNY